MDIIKQQFNRLWKMILIVSLFLYPIISNMVTVQAYSSYEYLGNIYDEQGRYGSAMVGNFRVDGRQAFCLEHDQETPPNGSSFSEVIFSNERLKKSLILWI